MDEAEEILNPLNGIFDIEKVNEGISLVCDILCDLDLNLIESRVVCKCVSDACVGAMKRNVDSIEE